MLRPLAVVRFVGPWLFGMALVGNRLATDLVDVTSDLDALDSRGFWAVVLPYSGPPVCAWIRSGVENFSKRLVRMLIPFHMLCVFRAAWWKIV